MLLSTCTYMGAVINEKYMKIYDGRVSFWYPSDERVSFQISSNSLRFSHIVNSDDQSSGLVSTKRMWTELKG